MNSEPDPAIPPGTTTASPIHQSREILERAESLVYKRVEDGPELQAHAFLPENRPVTGSRTAILFFFGSCWDQGSITQFAPQALYFANRGAVSFLFEYRVATTHPCTPADAIRDARSAVRWLRFHAEKIGVDPHRIVSAGSGAGAHIAAASVMVDDLSDDPTDPNLSGEPDALILFSPIVDVMKTDPAAPRFSNPGEIKRARLSRYIRKGLPPTLIFHGTRDRIAPFDGVRKFCRRMQRKRNVCELIHFEGRENRFFNLNVDPVNYELCISKADQFLVGQGFLEEDPSVADDGIRLESWRKLDP